MGHLYATGLPVLAIVAVYLSLAGSAQSLCDALSAMITFKWMNSIRWCLCWMEWKKEYEVEGVRAISGYQTFQIGAYCRDGQLVNWLSVAQTSLHRTETIHRLLDGGHWQWPAKNTKPSLAGALAIELLAFFTLISPDGRVTHRRAPVGHSGGRQTRLSAWALHSWPFVCPVLGDTCHGELSSQNRTSGRSCMGNLLFEKR